MGQAATTKPAPESGERYGKTHESCEATSATVGGVVLNVKNCLMHWMLSDAPTRRI